MLNTVHNPASLSEALEFMSELSGISQYYDEVYHKLEDLYYMSSSKVKPKKTLLFKTYTIKVFDKEGKKHQFYFENKRFDEHGIVAERFEVRKIRSIVEYGIDYSFVKKVRIDEGNGWYSTGGIFKIKGQEFYFEM
jgi:hypothetical protein